VRSAECLGKIFIHNHLGLIRNIGDLLCIKWHCENPWNGYDLLSAPPLALSTKPKAQSLQLKEIHSRIGKSIDPTAVETLAVVME
jgi:hypothetical protein